jgi:selenocysteine lyase/cysteine desulfurase
MPDILEAGTQNVHGFAGLAAGIEFVLETGVENILAHEQKLAKILIDGLKKYPSVHVYRPDCLRVGTVSLNIEGTDPSDVCDWLASNGVCVRGGAHCAPLAHDAIGTGKSGAVRFSFGWYNTVQEVQEVVSLLGGMLDEIC